MKITYDSHKREKTLTERGLDFIDAAIIFRVQYLNLKIHEKTIMKKE